ncbi:MAG: histidine kinase dimerization/phosphoacceptor domain -containing protein [Bacteroidia bacterium]
MSFAEKNISSSFPTLLDNFTEGILILNKDHEVIFTSNLLNSMVGFSQEELLEKSLEDLFPENKDELKSIFQAAQYTESIVFYTKLKRKNHKLFVARIRIVKNTDKNSEEYFFLYIKDNTPYQRIRRDLLRKTLTVEQLSKSRKIRDGKLDLAIYEIVEMASRAMNTQRVNAWVFNEDHSEIHCIGNFDSVENKLIEQKDLPRIAMPNYFKLFETEKIIITSDAFNDKQTSELLEIYLKPHNIHSLMDIPIRIEGEMIGVVCFEHTNTVREWNLQEQKFGLVIAQMISLALETSEKQKIRIELEAALKEQKVLLQEVHHRVKNNLTIIASLLNLQANKAKDDYHKKLFYESRDRLNSIATVHQLLYQSKSYSSVNFKLYIEEILKNLYNSFSADNKKITIKKEINDVDLDVSTAIPLALIVNELVTNSYKHAFNKIKEGVIEVSLTENNKRVFLRIKDNGPGYDFNDISKSSVGLDILHGLIEQINATIKYDNQIGSVHDISFLKS